MNREKALNIRTMLVYGLDLQQRLPQIKDEYTKHTCKQIARKHGVADLFNVKPDTAIAIVLTALKGYNGGYPSLHVKPYKGLLAPKVFNKLSTQHQTVARLKNGKKQLKKHKGIHAQTPQQRAECLKNALKARGIKHSKPIVEFSEKEKQLILVLAQNPAYRAGSKIRVCKITKEVNKQRHSKKDKHRVIVRKPRSIGSLIQKMKKRKLLV